MGSIISFECRRDQSDPVDSTACYFEIGRKVAPAARDIEETGTTASRKSTNRWTCCHPARGSRGSSPYRFRYHPTACRPLIPGAS